MKINRVLIPLLAMLPLLGIGCGDDGLEIEYSGYDCIQNNPNFSPEPIPAPEGDHQLVFRPNKAVQILGSGNDANPDIINGRNRLFHYRYQLRATDTLTRELFFEIEPGIDEFTISGDDLKFVNTYLSLNCNGCEELPEGVFGIENGCIRGRRIDANNWQVDINVNTTQQGIYVRLMSSATFQKAD